MTQFTDTAELLTSELVTNAYRHSTGPRPSVSAPWEAPVSEGPCASRTARQIGSTSNTWRPYAGPVHGVGAQQRLVGRCWTYDGTGGLAYCQKHSSITI